MSMRKVPSPVVRGVIEGTILLLLIVTATIRFALDRSWEGRRPYPPPEASVETLIARADQAYEREDLATAGALYADALRKDPDLVHAKLRLADLFHRNSWPDNAMEVLSDVLADHPDNARARLLLARLYRDEGQSDQASKEYEAVLRTSPDNAAAQYYLGTAYQSARRFEDAIRAYLAAIKADVSLEPPPFEQIPVAIQARLQLGRTYRQLANVQFQANARDDGMQLLDLALDQMRKAEALVERVQLAGYDAAKSELTSTLVQKANMLRRIKAPESAVLEVYDEITKVDPEDVGAWLEAGQIRYRTAKSREDLEKAKMYFETAYKLDPRDLDAYAAIKNVDQDLSRPEDELRQILDLPPLERKKP